jgi:hypothetical protein
LLVRAKSNGMKVLQKRYALILPESLPESNNLKGMEEAQ